MALVGGHDWVYGGGTLEKWTSRDGGRSWKQQERIVPEEGLIYNNPKWVEDADGGIIEDCLLFYGWQGPGGIHEDPSEDANRGRAYLWWDGEWV